MTVKESHDIIMSAIDRLDSKYEKHIDNHSGDIKTLSKFMWGIAGGLAVITILVIPIAIKLIG